jgi:hypothetical protein
MNWKDRGNGRYDALASRAVGGKYFIQWVESYYSDDYGQRFDVRAFNVDYQPKGGGRGNIDQVKIRTLKEAKALAELDHNLRAQLLQQYGDYDRIPQEAWGQLGRERRIYQGITSY